MNPLNPFFGLLVARGFDPKACSSNLSPSQPKIIDEDVVGSKNYHLLLELQETLLEEDPNIGKYFIFHASPHIKPKSDLKAPEAHEFDDVEYGVIESDDEDLSVDTESDEEFFDVEEPELDDTIYGVPETEDEIVRSNIQTLKDQALAKLAKLEGEAAKGFTAKNAALIRQIKEDVMRIIDELLEYTDGMAANEDVVQMKISVESYFKRVFQSTPVSEAPKLKKSDTEYFDASDELPDDLFPVVKNGAGESMQPKGRFWETLNKTSLASQRMFKGVQNFFGAVRHKAGEIYHSLIGGPQYGPLNQKEALQQNVREVSKQIASSIAFKLRQSYFSIFPGVLADAFQKIVEVVLSSTQFLPFLLSNVATSAHENLIADPKRAAEIVDRLLNNEIAILGDELTTVHQVMKTVELSNPGVPKKQLEGLYLKGLRESGRLAPDFEPDLTADELELRELDLSLRAIPEEDREALEAVRKKCQMKEHLYFKTMAERLYELLLFPAGLSPQLQFLERATGTNLKELSVDQIASLIEKQVDYFSEFKNICPLITKMLRQASGPATHENSIDVFLKQMRHVLVDIESLPERLKSTEEFDVRNVGFQFDEEPAEEVKEALPEFKLEADMNKLVRAFTHIGLDGSRAPIVKKIQDFSGSVLDKIQTAPAVQKVSSFVAERRYDRLVGEKVRSIASPLIEKVNALTMVRGAKAFVKAKFEQYRIKEKSSDAVQAVYAKFAAVKDFAQDKVEDLAAAKISAAVTPSIKIARNQVLDKLKNSGDQLLEERLRWFGDLIEGVLRPREAVEPLAPVAQQTEEEMRADLTTAVVDLLKRNPGSEETSREMLARMIAKVTTEGAVLGANGMMDVLSSKVLNRHLIISLLDGFLGAFPKQ